jgi:hypothetical protein
MIKILKAFKACDPELWGRTDMYAPDVQLRLRLRLWRRQTSQTFAAQEEGQALWQGYSTKKRKAAKGLGSRFAYTSPPSKRGNVVSFLDARLRQTRGARVSYGNRTCAAKS